MTLGALKEKLERVRDIQCTGDQRQVRVVVQSPDGFQWLDVELTSVEEFTGAPALVLAVTLTPKEETDFMRVLETDE